MNQFGIEEFVDTICDAIEFISKVEATQEDGTQFQDAFVLMTEYDTILEIKKDWPIFRREVIDLTSEEFTEAVKRISERTGKAEGWVRNNLVRVLKVADRAQRLFHNTKAEVLDMWEDIKLIGQNVAA